MKYTRKDLEELRNNPMAKYMAKMMGLNLNEIINDEIKNLNEPEDPFIRARKEIVADLDKLVELGILDCKEENGAKHYTSHVEVPKTATKEEVDNKVEPKFETNDFAMTLNQFKKFIKDYRELIAAQKKLSYLYGIKFEDGDSGFGFTNKINEIIWDLMRIIFKEENLEDIADFIFGNSNFDSEEALYNELV